jgi:hypothetical protein
VKVDVNAYTYIGIVEHGRLRVLLAEDGRTGVFQLTAADVTQPPEAMDLSAHESHVVLVRGASRGEWIHSAVVVEQAGPLLAVVAQLALGQTPRFPQG